MKINKNDVLLYKHFGLGINYCRYNDDYINIDGIYRIRVRDDQGNLFNIKTEYITHKIGQVQGIISLDTLKISHPEYFI